MFKLMNYFRLYLFFASIYFIYLLPNVFASYGYRTQYHEQGIHYNPKSYKFGYETGDHYNPQSRHEVSHGPGHVKGHYSFVDSHGKLQVVHYEAHPKYGFRQHGGYGRYPKKGRYSNHKKA